jgi:hypothetical protein
MEGIFDPLDYRIVAKSVVDALLSRALEPLPPGQQFVGGGVYAIYYAGSFRVYEPVSGKNVPIYVGKAVPAGGRKGGEDLESLEYTMPNTGQVLFKRLGDHAESVKAANNLDVADFTCRYLPVTPIWIAVAEGFLIRRFRPIWNLVAGGFGNHDIGKSRHSQKRSEWDTIHPGRHWAQNCQPSKRTSREILEAITKSFH